MTTLRTLWVLALVSLHAPAGAHRASPPDPRDQARELIERGLRDLDVLRFDEAIAAFTAAERLAPDWAVPSFDLGTAAYQAGRYREAEEAFVRAARLDAQMAPKALVNAGLAAVHDRRAGDAQRHQREADALFSADPDELARKRTALAEGLRTLEQAEELAAVERLTAAAREAGDRQPDRATRSLAEALSIARAAPEVDPTLVEVLRRMATLARHRSSRFSAQVEVAGGYDSNATQSGVLVGALGPPNAAAPFVSLDLRLSGRPAGTPRNGFSLGYAFSQLAYSSPVFQSYSVEEHEVTVEAAWSPVTPLSLSALAHPQVYFVGLRGFAPLQLDLPAGARIVVREPARLETVLGYEHTVIRSLSRDYDYLTGGRDEVTASQGYRGERVQLSVGYLFHDERIGTQVIATEQSIQAFAGAGVYHIPYSYRAHGATAQLSLDLPASLAVGAAFRYEHRTFPQPSFIVDPATGATTDPRFRVDDRYLAAGFLSWSLRAGFELRAEYSLLVSRSNIDNTSRASPLDYDNRNFLKHVAQLEVAFRY
jgi:tetratricopeptide (TPR) repeat protein